MLVETPARAALLTVLLFAPLGAHAGPSDKTALLEALQTARQRWQEAAPVNYSFTISDGCFCLHPLYAGPLRISVRHGRIQRIVYVGKPWDGYAPGREIHTDTPLATTIPQLFTDIENRIGILNATFVQAAYDSDDGHPTLFAYDDPSLEDEQTYISVTDFVSDDPKAPRPPGPCCFAMRTRQ